MIRVSLARISLFLGSHPEGSIRHVHIRLVRVSITVFGKTRSEGISRNSRLAASLPSLIAACICSGVLCSKFMKLTRSSSQNRLNHRVVVIDLDRELTHRVSEEGLGSTARLSACDLENALSAGHAVASEVALELEFLVLKFTFVEVD